MKIEKLPYFIDLYETRSYTKTARNNYISQTSVTQFINSLEEELQVKLFDRTTLPIQPTAAGTRMPRHCCGSTSASKRDWRSWTGTRRCRCAFAIPPRLICRFCCPL